MVRIVNTAEQANAITHSGTFHCDEVMASVMLDNFLELCGKNLNLLRTNRIPDGLDTINAFATPIIFDIGHGALDHHQKGGNGSRENGTPYAACGLVWRAYGRAIVDGFADEDMDDATKEWMWAEVDRSLVQPIDAQDSGMSINSDTPVMTFSHAISLFNPNWDETAWEDDVMFKKAAEFAGQIFDLAITSVRSKARAKNFVLAAVENSEGGVMTLDNFAPWQNHLFDAIAKGNEKAAGIFYVVYPGKRGDFQWRVVPDAPGSFGQKCQVPTEWKGLNGPDLQAVCGVADASFCHPAGFIGGAKSKEGAIEMARKAIASNQ